MSQHNWLLMGWKQTIHYVPKLYNFSLGCLSKCEGCGGLQRAHKRMPNMLDKQKESDALNQQVERLSKQLSISSCTPWVRGFWGIHAHRSWMDSSPSAYLQGYRALWSFWKWQLFRGVFLSRWVKGLFGLALNKKILFANLWGSL